MQNTTNNTNINTKTKPFTSFPYCCNIIYSAIITGIIIFLYVSQHVSFMLKMKTHIQIPKITTLPYNWIYEMQLPHQQKQQIQKTKKI